MNNRGRERGPYSLVVMGFVIIAASLIFAPSGIGIAVGVLGAIFGGVVSIIGAAAIYQMYAHGGPTYLPDPNMPNPLPGGAWPPMGPGQMPGGTLPTPMDHASLPGTPEASQGYPNVPYPAQSAPYPNASVPIGTGVNTAAGPLCPNCGSQNEASALVCDRCGTRLNTR